MLDGNIEISLPAFAIIASRYEAESICLVEAAFEDGTTSIEKEKEKDLNEITKDDNAIGFPFYAFTFPGNNKLEKLLLRAKRNVLFSAPRVGSRAFDINDTFPCILDKFQSP